MFLCSVCSRGATTVSLCCVCVLEGGGELQLFLCVMCVFRGATTVSLSCVYVQGVYNCFFVRYVCSGGLQLFLCAMCVFRGYTTVSLCCVCVQGVYNCFFVLCVFRGLQLFVLCVQRGYICFFVQCVFRGATTVSLCCVCVLGGLQLFLRAVFVFRGATADSLCCVCSGEQGGYNIPEVQHVPELSQWLSESNFEHILNMEDDRQLPEHMRRLLCDAYMVMYQSPSVMMFR